MKKEKKKKDKTKRELIEEMRVSKPTVRGSLLAASLADGQIT